MLKKMGEAVARVARKVNETVESGSDTLDLAECKLVSFPIGIYKVLWNVSGQIHLITLANNELKSLTSKFMTTFSQLRDRVSLCSPGWSAVVRSQLLQPLSPGILVPRILVPQPLKKQGLQSSTWRGTSYTASPARSVPCSTSRPLTCPGTSSRTSLSSSPPCRRWRPSTWRRMRS
uniref:Leucine rich repeat containing 20 n=1 Tax=Pongo abelii TaxID=9601 RepID=A0A8I5T700_PONAB